MTMSTTVVFLFCFVVIVSVLALLWFYFIKPNRCNKCGSWRITLTPKHLLKSCIMDCGGMLESGSFNVLIRKRTCDGCDNVLEETWEPPKDSA